MKYYLAVDIGASSGRHILFWKEADGIHMKEVYRFVNQTTLSKGRVCWDIEALTHHVIEGMKRCKTIGCIPVSMAIDTWGVDYVLLDEKGAMLDACVCYRDHSFDHAMEDVFAKVSKETLYQRTGIQFQQFNTIFQLHEMKKHIDLQKAQHFLMMPDYLNYVLTGCFHNEYTNATTSGLVHASKKDWDWALLKQLQIPAHMFHPLIQPMSSIATLRPSIRYEVGYDTAVVACASHDTGSAFLVPKADKSILISSGTWSLIGIHRRQPNLSKECMEKNYTNEGGYHTIRFLKNIMGLWLLQELQRDWPISYTIQELITFAKQSKILDTVMDVNDHRFLKPLHIVHEIDSYCIEHQQQKPCTVGEYVQCICHSLAYAYHQAIFELEALEKKTYASIEVIGGGVQNEYLNQWIEQICHKKLIRGVVEATALGNAMCQMKADQCFASLDEARAYPLIVHPKEDMCL